MLKISKKQFLLISGFVLFLVYAYFPIFLHLDAFPIQLWDEGLFALRAFHLADTGEFLNNFNQFDGLNHHPNTKYPLITIIQALSFKLLGYDELALRLPTSIMTLVLVFIIIHFFYKEFKDKLSGFFGAMVLLTAIGFMDLHVARTGDHDIFIVFFQIMILFSFYRFIHYPSMRKKHLNYIGLYFILGFLTKGIMIFFCIPALIIYALIYKEFFHILKIKRLYGVAAIVLLAIAGYFVFREITYPGFLKIYWDYELWGRFSSPVDGHKHYFWFYLNKLFRNDFSFWLTMVPLSILFFISKRGKQYRPFITLLGIFWISFFLIISAAQTKLIHYAAALYPVMAMLIGVVLSHLYYSFREYLEFPVRSHKSLLLFVLLIAAIFTMPYRQVIRHNITSYSEKHATFYGKLMEKMEENNSNYTSFTLAPYFWNPSAIFYANVYEKVHGYDITIKKPKKSALNPGEIVMLLDRPMNQLSEDNYEVLNKYKKINLIKIHPKKKWKKIPKHINNKCEHYQDTFFINKLAPKDTLIQYTANFEYPQKCDKSVSSLSTSHNYSGKNAQKIYKKSPYSIGFNNKLYKFPVSSNYLKVEACVLKTSKHNNGAFVIQIERNNQKNIWKGFKIDNYITDINTWETMKLDYRFGNITTDGKTKIKAYFYNKNKLPIYIDDITISVY